MCSVFVLVNARFFLGLYVERLKMSLSNCPHQAVRTLQLSIDYSRAQMILNVENRPRWDDLCDHGSVVKRLGHSSDIIYLSYQGKLGVCARDLCLLRCVSVWCDPNLHPKLAVRRVFG